VFHDLDTLYPGRITNKTNGITPRRWLLTANPGLTSLLRETIGDGFLDDAERLVALAPYARDATFQERFAAVKQANKARLAKVIQQSVGVRVDPTAMFDVQIKRIHEYKRQLLNVLHVIVLYNRLRRNPSYPMNPHTFFFAGKAAPAYHFAKLVIKLISQVAVTINRDPAVSGRLKVLFLPEYNVSLAERLIPASDVSEQISTAGYEASGTGNMKFMMNGALTIGTRDGATIEMAQEAGEENFFLFGLTAQEVADSNGWYDPHWHYTNEPETREALDLIFSDHFCPDDRGVFGPIRRALLDYGDHYRHLADLTDYARAHRELDTCYSDSATWYRKAIFNVACSGRFSSDRTIREYADEIWNLKTSQVS
jgi:starch phosphorylase